MFSRGEWSGLIEVSAPNFRNVVWPCQATSGAPRSHAWRSFAPCPQFSIRVWMNIASGCSRRSIGVDGGCSSWLDDSIAQARWRCARHRCRRCDAPSCRLHQRSAVGKDTWSGHSSLPAGQVLPFVLMFYGADAPDAFVASTAQSKRFRRRSMRVNTSSHSMMTSTPQVLPNESVRCTHSSRNTHLYGDSRIRINGGNTQVWNQAGQVHAMFWSVSARASDPHAHVWKGQRGKGWKSSFLEKKVAVQNPVGGRSASRGWFSCTVRQQGQTGQTTCCGWSNLEQWRSTPADTTRVCGTVCAPFWWIYIRPL